MEIVSEVEEGRFKYGLGISKGGRIIIVESRGRDIRVENLEGLVVCFVVIVSLREGEVLSGSVGIIIGGRESNIRWRVWERRVNDWGRW